MKIKELKQILEQLDENKNIVLSSDEELNTIFNKIELCELDDEDRYCLFGLSGSEDEY